MFKNINGQKHQILAESTTNVRIFVSYVETHFVTETRYTLYDSRCSVCENTHVSTRPVKFSFIINKMKNFLDLNFLGCM